MALISFINSWLYLKGGQMKQMKITKIANLLVLEQLDVDIELRLAKHFI